MNDFTKLMFFLLVSFCCNSFARSETASHEAQTIAQKIFNATDMFFVDCHEFPKQLRDLIVKPKGCKFWGPDPYLKKIPNDPWDRPWQYKRTNAKNYELKSLGADGVAGGLGKNMDLILNHTAPHLKK